MLKSPSSEEIRLDRGRGTARHSPMAGGIVIEEEQRILGSIEAHGWYAVHRYDPELVEPNYTYSVGFSQTLDAPEFIVFGLHRDVMYDMLAGIYDKIKAGRKLEDNQVWKGLHEDFDCVARKVSHEDAFEKYAVLADWLWARNGQGGHPALVQIVWPGLLDGLYPWDPGCRDAVKEAQPKLWR
nr:DUF4262 domain-containing protein [uncultured Hyphomonas sp.]